MAPTSVEPAASGGGAVHRAATGGFLAVELGGVPGGDQDGGGKHGDGGDGAAEIEEQHAVAEDGGVRAAEEGEVAEDEQKADLGGAEEALRELEAGRGCGWRDSFRGEEEKGDEHGEARFASGGGWRGRGRP